ncbi:hypothetical protein LPTSP3_g15580 [Leptospira kobayashii]|uniref:Uncharacterized protein n=1 Tax=Leptospira kobayashii TaxID=1917830 RepID=A0ABM7UIY2_9LEPT|nr:hypothetical protein [Leptospira kobayashii]BDA78628.1 hypothetical protein LPTSP3_g15580 [Leptospira kobayashii]
MEEVRVEPFTATLIVPVVTPDGAVTVRTLLVALVTEAVTPLNLTTLFAKVVEKFDPEMETDVPAIPNVGEKPESESEVEVEVLVLDVPVAEAPFVPEVFTLEEDPVPPKSNGNKILLLSEDPPD